jgi:lysophospholipid acyltransferase (LPLAT)-like uncharacterized protein
MTRGARYPLWLEPATWLAAMLMRGLGASWRIERVGEDPSDPGIGRHEPSIFALWHSQLLPLVYTHRGRDAVVLVSRHLDGQIVARVLERLGFRTARGSSTRGGGEGMLELLAHAEAGRHLALTPDGPRGPAEVVKPGIIYLASRTGMPVIPVVAAARPSRRLGSWDGMRVPWPFARLRVESGAALRVPPGLDEAGEERWRTRLETELRALTERVRAAVGEPR